MILKKILKAAVIVSLSIGAQAHAARINCPTAFTADGTGKVTDATKQFTAASDCEYLDTEDNSRPATVENINIAGFFGHSDWTLNGANLQITRGAAMGNWTIAAPDFNLNDYMIVFKDGNNTDLIGFLFNEDYSTGAWSTPFTDPPFNFNNNNPHNVSHYTIVQRINRTVQVPEPGVMSLLGLGVAGLAAARRRPLKK